MNRCALEKRRMGPTPKYTGILCKVQSCQAGAKLLGFCRFHYHRDRRGIPPNRPFAQREGKFINCYPKAKGTGGRREHVVIAERALGHSLPKGAEVHHRDGVKSHNWNRNLVICQSHKYHAFLEVRERVYRAGGDPNMQRICADCKRLVPIESIVTSNQCRGCKRARDKRGHWSYLWK